MLSQIAENPEYNKSSQYLLLCLPSRNQELPLFLMNIWKSLLLNSIFIIFK